MKISFLSTFYPYRGGIAQFNASVYRELEKNHTTKAYTFKRQYPNFLFPGETQFVTENDSSDKIPAIRILDTINPFTYWKTSRRIKKENPDILIMKYWMTFFAPSLGTVAKRMNKQTKRICILDNLIPHERRFFDTVFNRFFLRHIDGFVVMSNKVLDDLLLMKPHAKYIRIDHPLYNHFGQKKDRIDSCSQLGLDPSKKYALFFGIIRDYKGLDLLLEAMVNVDNDIELIVAGEVYGTFEKYQNIIDKNNLTERVHLFNKYISDNDVPVFFSAADVCVLPYKSATQSGITSISYHFNLPLIATDVGGLKETIIDNETGLIVPEISSNLISSSINKYFNEELSKKFEPYVTAYKEKNSWENFSIELLKFAESINKNS